MNKAYNRINWENYPSTNSPLNQQNLNRMDGALDVVDDRIISLDTNKATKIEVSTLISDATYDEATGVITFTRKNGATIVLDTKLEKLAVNFGYDPVAEQLVITLDDGTKQYVDLSALITQYEFLDSDTIAFQIQPDGEVKAIVKEGSIEEKHLRPDYLADIKVEAGKAGAAAESAEKSAEAAKESETNTKASEESAATSAEIATEAAESVAENTEAAEGAATRAEQSAVNAKKSEEDAAKSATDALESKESATNSAVAAESSKNSANLSEINAGNSATLSKSWAVGGTGIREGEDIDNSEYYSKQSKKYLGQVENAGNNALETINNALNAAKPEFVTNVDNGHLYYKGGRFLFRVDKNGHLKWGLMI